MKRYRQIYGLLFVKIDIINKWKLHNRVQNLVRNKKQYLHNKYLFKWALIW